MKITFLFISLFISLKTSVGQLHPYEDSQMKLLTDFKRINNDNIDVFYIAIGQLKGNSKKIFLLKNEINNFEIPQIDTAGISISICSNKNCNYGTIKTSCVDIIELNKSLFQPSIKTNNKIIAFDLLDTIASDLSASEISDIWLLFDKKKGGQNTGKVQIRVEKNKTFFIDNKLIINKNISSFSSIKKYEKKPIILYSLIEKSPNEVSRKIGLAESFKLVQSGIHSQIGDTIFVYSKTYGKYEITYSKGKSYLVEFYPKERFKCSSTDYFINKVPFELYTTKDYFSEEINLNSITRIFRNKPSHIFKINCNGRFLEKVIVEVN